MWKSVQSWIFGRHKSDPPRPEDEEPSTSASSCEQPQTSSTTIDVEEGPSKSSVYSGDPEGRPRAHGKRKWTTSNVLQRTEVDENSVIPPVTALVLHQNTADRLTKAMDKFDFLTSHLFDSPEPRRKHK